MKDKQRSTSQVEDKHTPGPWHHDEYGHICAGPQIIGNAYQFELDDSDHDELPCIPNARLMAAAPELLEALKDLLQYGHIGGLFHMRDSYYKSRKQATNLVAKIEDNE